MLTNLVELSGWDSSESMGIDSMRRRDEKESGWTIREDLPLKPNQKGKRGTRESTEHIIHDLHFHGSRFFQNDFQLILSRQKAEWRCWADQSLQFLLRCHAIQPRFLRFAPTPRPLHEIQQRNQLSDRLHFHLHRMSIPIQLHIHTHFLSCSCSCS